MLLFFYVPKGANIMKCLLKYQWVKLPRDLIPQGKGIMGYWSRVASRAAFRSGQAKYCGYTNEVTVGSWAGGVVGLKSILGHKSRIKALETMDTLSSLGYLTYDLDAQTKKLTYQISDFVVKCSGEPCMDGVVYTTDGYGFLCLPRNITERLVEQNYVFEDADAWLDLWCHTVYEDPRNVFTYMAPIVQFGQYGAALTLENLGRRWNWEKTKVWRFLQRHGDAFTLHKLPGSFGCLIFNTLYPTSTDFTVPTQAEITRILDEIRIYGEKTHLSGTDNYRVNRLINWYSCKLHAEEVSALPPEVDRSRVAVSAPIIRAYISQCWNCKNYLYDCRMKDRGNSVHPADHQTIRGPCQGYGPRFTSEGGSP